MSKEGVRQHIVLRDEFHKTVRILAAEEGCSNSDIVEGLLTKNQLFKKKLTEVRRMH